MLKNELINTEPLNIEATDLTNKIIEETDPSKLEDLTNLFIQNQKKKDLVRVSRLNNLLDIVDAEMETRVSECPESIENETLLKYATATRQAIKDAMESGKDVPTIQVTKNEINISSSELDKDSRERILKAVSKIIAANDIIDVEEK